MEANVLKISGQSNPNSVAGAISGLLQTNDYVELRAVGAAAVNQAVKSIAIARGFVAPSGKNLICVPAFGSFTSDNNDSKEDTKSLMKFIVKSVI